MPVVKALVGALELVFLVDFWCFRFSSSFINRYLRKGGWIFDTLRLLEYQFLDKSIKNKMIAFEICGKDWV